MIEALIWTDGSCSKQHGGWACFVFRYENGERIEKLELSGAQYPTTNNRMELLAAIEGLSTLKQRHHVYLISDSAYMLNVLKWKRYKSWFDRINRPNWDLWETLIVLYESHDVELVKVRSHGHDPLHDAVDSYAVQARNNGRNYWYQFLEKAA